jgi:hypothetical protein
MEKKQTAVEQLINEMKSLLDQPYVNPKNALNDCINLAYNKLQMEKEQIVNSYRRGCMSDDIKFADDYYNETYGGNNE